MATELTVTIPDWIAARLAVFIDAEQGRPDLAAVVDEKSRTGSRDDDRRQ